MAISTTKTLLSLDRYAEIMGVSLVHFNNLFDGTAPQEHRDYWTRDLHEDLADAIGQAEEMLAERLGFDVAPVCRQAAVKIPSTYRRDWWNLHIKLPHGHLQQLGSASWQVVQRDAAVTLDAEHGTVTVETEPISRATYGLFYRVTDDASEAGHETWRIRLTDVQINDDADQITFTAPRAVFIKPNVLSESSPPDVTEDANFVEAVDVYALVHTSVLPVTLIWPGDSPDGSDVQTGAGRIVDEQHGCIQVRPATYNSETGQHITANPLYSSKPERFTVSYQAGYGLQGDRIDNRLEKAIVRLTNTLLPETAYRFSDMAQVKWRGDRQTDEATGLPYGMVFAFTVADNLSQGR
ncbi:hypothetical protein ACFLYO_09735 [Chloroflexota bacterium]